MRYEPVGSLDFVLVWISHEMVRRLLRSSGYAEVRPSHLMGPSNFGIVVRRRLRTYAALSVYEELLTLNGYDHACLAEGIGVISMQRQRSRPARSMRCKKQGHMSNRGPIRMKTGGFLQETGAYEDSRPFSNEAAPRRRRSRARAFIRNRPGLRICPSFLQKSPDSRSNRPPVTHMPLFFAELDQGRFRHKIAARAIVSIWG